MKLELLSVYLVDVNNQYPQLRFYGKISPYTVLSQELKKVDFKHFIRIEMNS